MNPYLSNKWWQSDNEEEPAHYCHHCQEGMDSTDGEFGEWCGFECWYADNKGAVRRLVLRAIEMTHDMTVDNVLWNLRYFLAFDLNQYTTPSTLERWKRAIQNRKRKSRSSGRNTESGLAQSTHEKAGTNYVKQSKKAQQKQTATKTQRLCTTQ